jgi:hypothetical protein
MVEKRHGRSLRLSGDRKEERFTSSLLHHVSVDLPRLAFFELKRNAAPGVDGLTWQDYAADLELRLADLHARVQRGAYRALPRGRTLTANGSHRPSGFGFRLRNSVGAQDMNLCEAQWLAYAFPYRRFAVALPIRIDPEPCAVVRTAKDSGHYPRAVYVIEMTPIDRLPKPVSASGAKSNTHISVSAKCRSA